MITSAKRVRFPTRTYFHVERARAGENRVVTGLAGFSDRAHCIFPHHTCELLIAYIRSRKIALFAGEQSCFPYVQFCRDFFITNDKAKRL